MWLLKAVATGLWLGSVYCSTGDPCTLDYDAGPCTEDQKYVITFDKSEGKCVPKIYGGCEGNENRFFSISECESVCSAHLQQRYQLPSSKCALPPILNTEKACFGYFPRFTFNAAKGACERVVYGGCGGSDNLFVREADCVSTCIQVQQRPDILITFPAREEKSSAVCSLPPIWPGPMACRAFVPKWTYSQGKCVEYVYGGCRGTGNLFDTEAECQATCSDKPGAKAAADGPSAEVCNLPIVPGPCRAMKKAYGFNKDTGRCERFTYGGCRGNLNRFASLEKCVDTCGGQEPDEKSDCSAVTCDARELSLYRAKGCYPITKPGECCPSSWDCSLWDARNDNQSLCFHASPSYPLGRLYSPGETLENATPDGCRQGCFCSGDGVRPSQIICAMVDCFVPRNFSYDRCTPQYKGPQSCCAAEFKCDAERDSLATCNLDGKLYRQGDKMFPRKDPCLACLCRPDWDGSLSAPACEPVDCGLGLSEKLRQGCEPVYRDGVCCPVDWLCPAAVVAANEATVIADPTELYSASRATALKPEDRCLLPQDPGTGDNSTVRYYFDGNLRQCVDFVYSGLGGNGNNFPSLLACREACKMFITSIEANVTEAESPSLPSFLALIPRQLNFYPGKAARCMTPVQEGVCRSRIRKYFYDTASGRCATFFYSGCRGGENMFDDLRSCVRACVPPATMKRGEITDVPVGVETAGPVPTENPCTLPKIEGPCRAIKARWWYNTEAGDCEQFAYGGCQGNANNFATEEACQAVCGTSSGGSPPLLVPPTGPHINIGNIAITLPERVGPVAARPGSGAVISQACPGCPTAVAIDSEIKKLAVAATRLLGSKLSTGDDGCGGLQLLEVLSARRQVVAGTNFILSLRIAVRSGPDCSGKETRTCSNIYVHRPLPSACPAQDDNCLKLIRESDINCYDNNDIVISPEDVTTATPAPATGRTVSASSEDRCRLPSVRGPCKALIPRFYYNTETRSCQEFIYGGCRGNENNFPSEAACRSACAPSSARSAAVPNVCGLPAEIGPCRAASARFYYNQDTRQCEEFIFGGCRGNGNNFHTEAACAAACLPQMRSAVLTPFVSARLSPFEAGVAEEQQQRCRLGNETYAVGDVVRLDADPCQMCVCSSPPSLSCRQKMCPLIAAVSRHRADCKEVRDDLGCCVVSYDCPSSMGVLPDIAGDVRFPVPGAPQHAVIDHEAKIVAAKAAQQLAEVAAVTGVACQHAQLIDILGLQRQVVAGTNFIFRLRVEARMGPLCQDRIDRYCREVRVYRPIGCEEAEYTSCLQLSSPHLIQCFESADQLR